MGAAKLFDWGQGVTTFSAEIFLFTWASTLARAVIHELRLSPFCKEHATCYDGCCARDASSYDGKWDEHLQEAREAPCTTPHIEARLMLVHTAMVGAVLSPYIPLLSILAFLFLAGLEYRHMQYYDVDALYTFRLVPHVMMFNILVQLVTLFVLLYPIKKADFILPDQEGLEGGLQYSLDVLHIAAFGVSLGFYFALFIVFVAFGDGLNNSTSAVENITDCDDDNMSAVVPLPPRSDTAPAIALDAVTDK